MNHQDHVHLLQRAVTQRGGVWADLGSGEGAFTLALRDLAGPDCEIYSVDEDAGRLARQQQQFRAQFPQSRIHFLRADFTRSLDLPPLDGIVMANALHYFRDKERVLNHLRPFLKPGGQLVLVEYNVDAGNQWVPYPLSFETFKQLAPRAGFAVPCLLATVPSRFLREIYSAAANANAAATSR